jgi:proline iminopeptidase
LRMKMALGNAQLHVVPNASHMPFYENPDYYYPALTGFLNRHRSSR